MREILIRECGGRTGALKSRLGPRPATTNVIPHRQLDQLPPGPVFEQLLNRCLQMRDIRDRESRVAIPGTLALCIPDELAGGPPDAFIDDHEFCYIHPLPDSSIHLTLPREVRDQAICVGWAECHPLVRTGSVPDTLVMVYAPRNESELEVVLELFAISAGFARGEEP